MAIATAFTAKILEVSVEELNQNDDTCSEYTFEVYELPNGAIMVGGEATNDWYFEDRDSIEPSGNGAVAGVEDTGRTVEFSKSELRDSLEGSIGEFGEDDATAKALELLA